MVGCCWVRFISGSTSAPSRRPIINMRSECGNASQRGPGVRIEGYWQTPSSRGRCAGRSTPAVCPPSAVALNRNGNQSQALEAGRVRGGALANGNQSESFRNGRDMGKLEIFSASRWPGRCCLPRRLPLPSIFRAWRDPFFVLCACRLTLRKIIAGKFTFRKLFRCKVAFQT